MAEKFGVGNKAISTPLIGKEDSFKKCSTPKKENNQGLSFGEINYKRIYRHNSLEDNMDIKLLEQNRK